MPIDYKDYHKKWTLIVRLIKKRSGGRCERCGVVNYSWINSKTRELCLQDEDNAVRVVLTTAHLDHDKTNNRFSNLAALCQKCHLRHDIKQHIDNRRYGRKWKKYQLKLEL